jgi:hypothetical protein
MSVSSKVWGRSFSFGADQGGATRVIAAQHIQVLLLALFSLSTAGCVAMVDRWNAVFPPDPWKPYAELRAKLGSPRSIDSLPRVKPGEVSLGSLRQANGTFYNDDGTFENALGSGGQCLFAFKVEPKIGRMVSWRFASKGTPDVCYPSP